MDSDDVLSIDYLGAADRFAHGNVVDTGTINGGCNILRADGSVQFGDIGRRWIGPDHEDDDAVMNHWGNFYEVLQEIREAAGG